MYRVKAYFTDLQDNGFAYNEGDIFPREGKDVSADRIKELSGTQNLRGIALIEEVRVAEVKTVPVETKADVEDEPRKRTRKRKSEE